MPFPALLQVPSYTRRLTPVPLCSAGRLISANPQAGEIRMEFNKEKKNKGEEGKGERKRKPKALGVGEIFRPCWNVGSN